MKQQLIIVGLDCVSSAILETTTLQDLPNLAQLVERGLSGPLESTMPPITIPAWTSMMSGRDPGELGIYGFRNRASYGYDDVFLAGADVRYPRIWDWVDANGGSSIIVGVPQTSPPPRIRGICISGFEAESLTSVECCHPPDVFESVGLRRSEFQFDVAGYRQASRSEVLKTIHNMTERRFDVMRKLLDRHDWTFAMLCEIGPDRMHHCFWRHHDVEHPAYRPDSEFENAIEEYYRFLDVELGRLLEIIDPDCAVLIVSDHGVKAMQGGVCINEVLRRSGWLALKNEPSSPRELDTDDIDWSRTRAWAEGGYYARVMLNVAGREPAGIIAEADVPYTLDELEELLEQIELPANPTLANQVYRPRDIYRRVRGFPPDLIVVFDNFRWRSIGSVGHDVIWIRGNDTGPDDANHAMDGVYVLTGGGAPQGKRWPASILDVAPTACSLLGLSGTGDFYGRNILAE